MWETIRSHPLALMTANGPDVPWATHLPVITHPDPERAAPDGALVGSTLLGHMNRRNPHWSALSDGGRALLIFQGPHGYVSPTVYRTSPAAPTWNFVAVHVSARLRPIHDTEETLRVVRWTVEAYEKSFGTGWDHRSSAGYFREIVAGVGAFTIAVEAADGMYKLSQEQRPVYRRRVHDAFAASDEETHQDLACLMKRADALTADAPGPG
jgi:transcriptional regulator